VELSVDWSVRMARPGDEAGICAVCRAGFAASSAGLIAPEVVAARSAAFYDLDPGTP
jgi:hypothetical protein